MPERTTATAARVDPRGPLVFDTRSFAHRPGTMERWRGTVVAPADLELPLVGVPEGTDIELDLRFESVVEGVLVSGTARTTYTGECARCLEPISSPVEVGLQELFAHPGPDVGEDESLLEGDLLDLEPVLRDAVLLELPQSPVCSEDCPGLCATCGVRLAEAGPEHRHDSADPRWAGLAGLYERMTNENEDRES
ncbi:MAG: DUF177 domain-containing protein [Streptosporangiales bacterium]|nr:DUF177 domain-containing protein [Streptosporangiales bacterium]MBO0892478.1 DUF177 domain-containing protein [Acidothermales bacterium]